MKSTIKKAEVVIEKFAGKNHAQFGGAGLIKRSLQSHGIDRHWKKRLKWMGVVRANAVLEGCLYAFLMGIPGLLQTLS